MTTRPIRLAATASTLAVSAFGLALLAGPAALAAQTTATVRTVAVHHGTDRAQIKTAAGDSCDPGDGDTGTMDDAGDCIDN